MHVQDVEVAAGIVEVTQKGPMAPPQPQGVAGRGHGKTPHRHGARFERRRAGHATREDLHARAARLEIAGEALDLQAVSGRGAGSAGSA